MCDASGNCYTGTGIHLAFVDMVPYCDLGGCFFYAFLNCNAADSQSGLLSVTTGQMYPFTCATQAGFPPLGSTSAYLKGATYSCSGQCLTGCIQCMGPFQASAVISDAALLGNRSSSRQSGVPTANKQLHK